MKKLRQHSKFNSYLKVSCSVLLMSGTLVGYGFTKDDLHNQMTALTTFQVK